LLPSQSFGFSALGSGIVRGTSTQSSGFLSSGSGINGSSSQSAGFSASESTNMKVFVNTLDIGNQKVQNI
jgi:hypothetical protein